MSPATSTVCDSVCGSQVASLVGADPKEIIFTSGATESNNLAIKGVANFYKEKKNHIITLQTDHKCVLDSCRYLQHRGFKVTYLPVKKDGLVDLELLKNSITPETVMVSVMMVNNEIGKQCLYVSCITSQSVLSISSSMSMSNFRLWCVARQ